MVDYRLSRAADEDLARLYRHGYERHGEEQADAYYDGLLERFNRIAARPEMYPVMTGLDKRLRRSVYGVHAIYYMQEPESVLIVRVLGREDRERALKKTQ